ncbi:aminotransferase class I/II-fold pyridoxal phosphate-dependent enzyme [Seongchinamella sediminis]|uniref:Aminotransferase class I/II-fold pyridoxal phosphate-dependent enzyme n=1 Tax=Seongchinamella sediminis TaxID=2283635 RepID=A0A3L7DU89_9GAMM|nr:amino acid aminotransferase [Seongchinamella sediminis]RLQ20964.1 aminotransferase class I/II-fold pyridoxal phosphate-dependent enzyme [Seongchinamella sediminis]
MLDQLQRLSADPILGLAAVARADDNPDKVDLTLGIYMNEEGVCPVFRAVTEAQAALAAAEVSKAYLPPEGVAGFNPGMQALVLGAGHSALVEGRVCSVQAPGGCGALRIGAEIIHAAAPDARVWVSDPTWPVHLPLLGSVGLSFETYRYYDPASHGVDFDGMVEDLKRARPGDVVLLHGCCHNPCGADLSLAQWQVIADMALAQGFMPFIDIAYQGLGDGLEEDAAGLRLLAAQLPEMVIAASCSKNMGLYRERTGATLFLGRTRDSAEALVSQALVAARRVYSMPPAHGALIAARILNDAALGEAWRSELLAMCGRINRLRSSLREKLEAASGRDFAFIEREKGMFSFLGLSTEQAIRLRQEHSVYMLDSSRINVAGVNARNIDYLASAVAKVL